MRIYALGQRRAETFDAAGKAMSDVYQILNEFGAKEIWNVPKKCNKMLKALDIPYLIIYILLVVGKSDFVFFSIPENGLKIRILDKLKKIKRFKSVCFINDINAFRYGLLESEEVQEKIRKEIGLISTADIVIAPNENTVSLFRKYGVQSKIIVTGVWDYLKEDLKIQSKKNDGLCHIAFAGNLNKSEFLTKIKTMPGIQLELWGKLDEEKHIKLPKCCVYHGVLAAADVPNAINWCDMGLVWDGTGANDIEGGLGEYLRYNNSHKCGLYLAAELPVIVWKEAGMAKLVERERCGIMIENLDQISQEIDKSKMPALKENAIRVGKEIRQGTYLRRAFREAFEGERK